MTIAQNFAAKLSVAFVAAAMIFSGFATTASAQTSEELQKMINDLLAQIAQLETSAEATTGGASCTTVMAPLTIGATGADVTALQNRLLADGEMIPAGATGYFGTQTQAALASWQGKNAVSPAVGYYGPITKAAMDASCVPADVDETDEDEDEDDDSSDMTLSGEASLDTMEMDSASDDEVEEGAEDAEIAMLTLEFTNGDAEISRLDVSLVGSGDEQDPWDTFEEIQLWVDGDMIASVNADDEDDYLDEDDGSLRFSNLDLFAGEDEEVEITIAATVMNSVDLEGDADAWTIQVDSLRFFDADGVATTEDSGMDFGATGAQDFTINEAGFDDELLIKTSSNDPDAATLQVEDSSKSDWYTVFVFDLDTDDSINDIEINTVAFDVTTVGASVASIVDDVEITIDGDSYDDWAFTTGTSGELTRGIEVDVDGDHTIDAGDRVEVEVMLRFKSANGSNYSSGATVSVTTDDAAFDAEGADDVIADGSASGDTHTLLTEGIDTEMTDSSAVVTTGDQANDDYATFEIEVEVTAFEQDVYIETDGSDINASIVSNAGTTTVADVVLSSTADETNNRFEINEGETETITLTVTYDPAVSASQSVRLVLNSIGFYEVSTGGTLVTQTTLPASDYRTGFVTIVN